MKISVTLKDPDGFYDCVKDAVRDDIDENMIDLSEDEKEDLVESRVEKAWAVLEKWVAYKEYVTITFDIDKGTATVEEE